MRLRSAGASQITANTDISCVLVTRIKEDSTNIRIGNDAATTYWIQNRQGRRSGRGKKESAVIQSNQTVVIVLWRNGDRANRYTAGDRRLTDNRVSNTFVGRAVKTIRPKVVGIGTTRSQSHWRVEIDRVSTSNVVCGNVAVATEEAPIAIGSSGDGIHTRKTDEIVGLVKVSVIHGHIDGVGTVLIDI